MKRIAAVAVVLFLVGNMFLLTSCKSDKPTIAETNEQEPIEIIDTVDEQNKEVEEEVIEFRSPLSGIASEKEKIERRPIAVMLDNHNKARPQAGLDQAEIIYEFLAEGWITRYMAIFLINEPELIGPVRSARPYFLDKAMEYDALYVHVGGSPQAFADIKNLKMADIDAMSRDGSIFWRKNHKKAPHNMYTSTNAIRKAAKDSKYATSVQYESWTFRLEDEPIQGNTLQYLKIPYYKNYSVEFKFNESEKRYLRYVNGQSHLDEISKQHLTAKNILIQKADTSVIDSEGRLEIDLVGKGTGYYITNGNVIDITWDKASRKSLTKYYDASGKEIQLNTGVTWVEVIPTNINLIME
ncbi:MAG: DUF3048 domain-containing protein [Bacillota bacterium]